MDRFNLSETRSAQIVPSGKMCPVISNDGSGGRTRGDLAMGEAVRRLVSERSAMKLPNNKVVSVG